MGDMGDITSVVLQILTLLMLAGCGIFLRKKQILTDPVIKGINSACIMVAWPAMVLMMSQKDITVDMLPGFYRVLFSAVCIMGGGSILVYVLGKKWLNEKKLPVFVSLAALPNSGFVGLPIVYAFYGDAGVIYLSAYIVGFNIVLWSMYLFIFGVKNKHPLKTIFNANVIASLISALLITFRIRIPDPFSSLFSQLGSLMTPMTMLLLGSRLIQSLKANPIWDKTVLTALFVRLILFPLGSYALGYLVGLRGMELGIIVLAGAMPAASTAQMFAEKYDKDIALAAQGTSLSLLLCLVTIPLILVITGL